MKVRPGFVTNSSSTSFVVVFDTEPKSVEELQKLLFGDEETVKGEWEQEYSTADLAGELFEEVRGQQRDAQKIGSVITDGIYVDNSFFAKLDGSGIDHVAYEKLVEKRKQDAAERYIIQRADKYICTLYYSQGSDSPFVDGHFLRELDHVRVSG